MKGNLDAGTVGCTSGTGGEDQEWRWRGLGVETQRDLHVPGMHPIFSESTTGKSTSYFTRIKKMRGESWDQWLFVTNMAPFRLFLVILVIV